MKSKNDEKMKSKPYEPLLPDEPKTPHEEVMFVVESTNDIVSEILVMLNLETRLICYFDHCPFRKRKK